MISKPSSLVSTGVTIVPRKYQPAGHYPDVALRTSLIDLMRFVEGRRSLPKLKMVWDIRKIV